jgi:hypothetical protein
MSWETRGGRGRYYTRSKRVGGRVRREYVGSGLLAELAAAEDALHREAREREARDRPTERERLEALDAPLGALDALTGALYRAALVAAGYRQHKRGEWRKRRAEDE